MFNILTLNKISASGLANFDSNLFACSDSIENPDAIIVRSASMHEMELPSNLLAVARAGAGVNNIPIDKCTENGICVFNTPGANANAVKELVICALFLTSRKVVAGAKWCETLKGNGDQVSKLVEKGKSSFAGPEILGKTLGVVGLGAIGILVANAAKALGMTVIGYDPFISDKTAAMLDSGITVTANLDDIFTASDYITLHAPLTDATRGIIGKDNFAKCKDGVRVLNFARAELVNSADMLEALASGKCAAYATDFATDELLCADGVTALPHLGASSPEAEENCAVMAVNQLAMYLKDGNVKNSVNLPELITEKNGNVRLTVISNGDITDALKNALTQAGITLNNAANAIKKNIGYAVFDTDAQITDDVIETIKGIEGVISLRII